MLIIDSDGALRERRSDSQPTDARHLSTHEAVPTHPEALPSKPALPRRLNTGVGWIEVVRPGPTLKLAPEAAVSISLPKPHDELSAARGIALGAALGLAAWSLMGGVIAILFL